MHLCKRTVNSHHFLSVSRKVRQPVGREKEIGTSVTNAGSTGYQHAGRIHQVTNTTTATTTATTTPTTTYCSAGQIFLNKRISRLLIFQFFPTPGGYYDLFIKF